MLFIAKSLIVGSVPTKPFAMKRHPDQKTTVKIGFDIGCLHRHSLAKATLDRRKHPHKLSDQIVKERSDKIVGADVQLYRKVCQSVNIRFD
jgi:hypothetical protein